MRKGFFWAAGALLASVAPTMAQDVAKPLATGSIVKVALQPPVVLPERAPTEMVRSFEMQPDRPRGFWVSADYLLWWVKGGPIPPIVTTSNNLGDAPPGALGQPGTQVLYGDRPIGYGTFSGLRLGAGIELAPGLAIEGNYFTLERRSQNFSASSDANGSPLIGIAFFNTAIGLEDALLTANPDANRGIWTGTASVVSSTRLQGWELNLAGQRQGCGPWTFTALAGFRALSLDEDLSIGNQFTPTLPGALTFNGAPVPAGTLLSDSDHFRTRNHFYGGQVGGRAEWQQGPFSLTIMGKIAFGATQEIITIDGSSSMAPPGGGAAVTVPGGVYAQTSNIGRYYQSAFAVVPEVGLNLGLAITERLTAKVGYSFLYWSRVARPGDQIDRNVHEALIPTHQFFGQSTPDGRPAPTFRQTEFWAQGINFGLEYRY